MNNISIIVGVRITELLREQKQGGKITHPSKFIIILDDVPYDHNRDGLPAESTTVVSEGDMLKWTIKSFEGIPLKLKKIDFPDTSRWFSNDPSPVNGERRQFQGRIIESKLPLQPENYTIGFYTDNNPEIVWEWDPVIESRERTDM